MQVIVRATLLMLACGVGETAIAQIPPGTDTVEERFARFLADYRPKAQQMHRHLFFDVLSKSSHAQYLEDKDDSTKPDERVIVHSVVYQGDATRFIRTDYHLHGDTGVTILRPEVNYLLLQVKGTPLRLTYKREIPGDGWKEIFGKKQRKFDYRECESLGIGLMWRGETLLTILTKEGIAVTDVQFHKDGVLDAATIHFHFPPNPDRYQFRFHTDIGISYRHVHRMERGVNTSVVEYDCPGRTVENYVPTRRVSTGVSLVKEMAPKLTDEHIVEEFRKQSQFDDSVFRLEQFGLPDLAPPPPPVRPGGVLIAILSGCAVVALLLVWRLGRGRRDTAALD